MDFYDAEPEEAAELPDVPIIAYRAGLKGPEVMLPDIKLIQNSCKQLGSRTVSVKELLEAKIQDEKFADLQLGRSTPPPNFLRLNRSSDAILQAAQRSMPPSLTGGARCDPFA